LENLVLFKKNLKFVENVFKKLKKYLKNEEIDEESEKMKLLDIFRRKLIYNGIREGR